MPVDWPLLERERLIERLLDCSRRSARQRGQTAVISGEAGVGKSTLMEAWSQRLQADATVAWGRCDALFTPRLLGPLHDMAGVLGAGVRQALEEGWGPERLFAAVLDGLGQLPPGSLLVFEDVHWADHATLDLLTFLVRRSASLRMVIALTYRSDETGPDHALTRLLGALPATSTTRLEVGPLSVASVGELARCFGQDADQLFRATAGNPFFLFEVLSGVDAGAGAGALTDPGRLPHSVRDAVLARVSRLAPGERRFLEATSVAPDPLPLAVIERLLGDGGLTAAAACESLGLMVREGPLLWRWRHELGRRAVLESLAADDRRAHHRRLLEVYRALGDRVAPPLVVHHAAAIDDGPTLLACVPEAARRAAALGSHKEAAAMLALALRHADDADPVMAATLYECWAYEAGLSEVTDAVLQGRAEAVARWRALGRPDRVGENLRWLWRLHWYRGETEQAEAAARESLAVLEAIAPSAELGRAYALRSHLHMLRGERAASIQWGRRAIDMAGQFGDHDTGVQTLVTVATALLFNGDDAGCALMEQALEAARMHGLHEQCARVYTNYSEYAIVMHRWALAERLVLEGLAFDVKYGLDSWVGYLSGRHAQLRLEQGRLDEAETLATGVLGQPGRTVLMRLPALTTLARVRSRRGASDAPALLAEVLQAALGMREQQRITPARLACIEHEVLQGDEGAARAHLQAMLDFGTEVLRPWDAGALRVWAHRLGMALPPGVGLQPTEPQALELAGQPEAAARAFDGLNAPFDAALVRLVAARGGGSTDLAAAARAFEALGCAPGLAATRRMARRSGVKLPANPVGGRAGPGVQARAARGPYGLARRHPLGLTAKEVEVLALLVEGASNADIAERLSRSQRTVEHHVSAILSKLQASNRVEAMLRGMAEPWLLQA